MTQPAISGSPTQNPWGSAVSSLVTFSHTVGALSSGALRVRACWADNNARTITGVTYNGVALTQVASTYAETATGSARVGVDEWLLVNPPATTANVVVTCSSAGLLAQVSASNWNNVHPTTPATGGTSGTSAVQALTPSLSLAPTANDLSVGSACFSFGGTITPDQTAIGSTQAEAVFILAKVSDQYSTGGTLSWTATSNDGVAYSAYVLKGTAAAGGSIVRQMMQHHG